MKRNVDLTEDRLFTTPEKPTGINKVLFDFVADLSRKPWEFNFIDVCSDLDFAITHPSLIPVGDKNDRKRWRLSQLERSGEICGCCGKDKGKLPWARKECGCSYLMIRTSKIPWDFE